MERGHHRVTRLPVTDLQERVSLPERRGIDAGVLGRQQQRPLGGAAADPQALTAHLQVGLVAERADLEQPPQRLRHPRQRRRGGGRHPTDLPFERGMKRPGLPIHAHLDHLHPVQGQRAGLVDAQHGDTAQRLHGRQLPDHHLTAQHAGHADRQGGGRDRRQSLGHGGDR